MAGSDPSSTLQRLIEAEREAQRLLAAAEDAVGERIAQAHREAEARVERARDAARRESEARLERVRTEVEATVAERTREARERAEALTRRAEAHLDAAAERVVAWVVGADGDGDGGDASTEGA